MTLFVRRLAVAVKWLVLILVISAAVITAAMRVVLPNLDTAKAPLERWASDSTGFEVTFSTFTGHWRYLVPSLSLHELTLATDASHLTVLTADSIDIQLDLWASLRALKPSFSHVTIHGLNIDLTQLPERDNAQETSLGDQLENLFLVGLGQFAVYDSSVTVLSPAEEKKTIDISSLRWDNQAGKHHMQGVFSVQGTSLNKVGVQGVFSESDGIDSLDGEFYLSADDVSLRDWIGQYINPDITLAKASIGGEAWLTVANGQPTSALVSLKDSALAWFPNRPVLQAKGSNTQALTISHGLIKLDYAPDGGWQLATQNLAIQSGNQSWPEVALRAEMNGNGWQLNLNQLDIGAILPLRELVALPSEVDRAIRDLKPVGQAKDIRVAQRGEDALAYSLTLENVGFQHWSYLPEVHKLHLDLVGVGASGKATLSLADDELPYGAFFQAPLPVVQGDVNLYWDYRETSMTIWSDKVAVRSPDLDVIGEFRLDWPFDGNNNGWLSFYAEANAYNAGETWRYLPTLALGHELTDYLSTAIRGGEAKQAKLLWFGDFDTFPYLDNQGVFQAEVPLRNGQFSFDTQWPTLTELDLNLLFQNDALYLYASNVNLLGARGYDLTGEIPSLSDENGVLLLDASIAASGDSLSNYMLATPLVDSVGAALTHVQVEGDVKGAISLHIPLNGDDVSVKGRATLPGNTVAIVSPQMTLNDVEGTVKFDNDIVWSDALSADLLSQPVKIDFRGETASDNYLVNIGMTGRWQADSLKSALHLPDLSIIEGDANWDVDVGIALKDVGFTYDVQLDADLKTLAVNLPAPLGKTNNTRAKGQMKASGDAQSILAQVELPNLKYQAEIDIRNTTPEVTKSRWIVGDGELSLQPLAGNAFSIDVPQLDVMAWQSVMARLSEVESKESTELPFILHAPTRINAKAGKLVADQLVLNKFSLAAREKNDGFHFLVGSEELSGDAWWDRGDLLTVSVEHLYLNLDHREPQTSEPATLSGNRIATSLDRELMAKVPSTNLVIDDLWLQGYRLGRLEAQLLKSPGKLALSKFAIDSGGLRLNANGNWSIDPKGLNHTEASFDINVKNTSDLMGRFSMTGGIQDATAMTKGELGFDSTPWAMDLASLDGKLETKIENGYISGVGGAGKLLGLFSLESILRKMQLDFTGVFEDGLAFNEIGGTASISNGVVVTDNIQMKALAGDMFIRGIANLVKNQVNADVRFVPDLTSGIPVLTAFAVTPQTALYVLAVTTVISPVVDAFTQVRYQVTGAIDDPVVREVSRSTGEVTLPQQATERLREQRRSTGQ